MKNKSILTKSNSENEAAYMLNIELQLPLMVFAGIAGETLLVFGQPQHNCSKSRVQPVNAIYSKRLVMRTEKHFSVTTMRMQ